jgi:serine/threonine protein kinase
MASRHFNCPSCSKEISIDSQTCPNCGVLIGGVTRRFDTRKTPTQSYDSIDNARFVPGTILSQRYRIVGLLGKGGMGEVYRADDLKLSQPVALKFLPDHLLRDGAALARFHREVRVARQVSHKNVCRVYDIGETDGR